MSDDSSEPKQGRFGPLSAISITLLAFFGSQIGASLIIGAFLAVTSKNADEIYERLSQSTFSQFIFVFLAEVLVLLTLYLFIRARKITLSELGLGRRPKINDGVAALIAFAIYFILAALALAVINKFLPGINFEQQQQTGFESANETAELIITFISLVVIVPITEEILIRGFLYSGIRRKYGKYISALAASLIFGIAHLQLGSGAPPLYVAAIDTFILSLVLIALREKTGSLWASIVVHSIKNCLAFIALFILRVG